MKQERSRREEGEEGYVEERREERGMMGKREGRGKEVGGSREQS